MPIRSDFQLAREGVTVDTFTRLIRNTALNPALTLPLLLLARYTSPGLQLAGQHRTALTSVKALLALGALHRVGRWLDDKVLNNWSGNKKDDWDWSKEIVVVTGGADGIGKIVVQLFAERGIKVAVLDIQPLTYEPPPSVSYFHCNLADPKCIASTATEIKTTLGDPTVLINNAGCVRGKSILESSEFDIHLTFNVNTISHYLLTQQFLPSMIEKNHGMVVTVASLAGYVLAPRMVDYAASKAASVAFHEGLAAELSSLYNAPNVRTVVMCQGYTRTALFDGFGATANTLYPETVAEEIVKAVYRGKSAHIVVPETAWMVAGVRGWPVSIQYSVRKGLDGIMKNFKGRQVEVPSEMEGEGKEVGDSTVLVGGE
ncbi:short chain dehydrogenase/reductase family protein-like protein [Massarina eburnea CBS 473.64]|uniref:Short-chain dehydrogenase/reductase 3 n=1 Tax=Massarina eburnea CBS 473.64 TaxID=1395130 RepID=A0A6A6S0M3_9PLEO|nr:short chain dehydrogenase/reductase family protein-like protein [Massarina eburnea CBS 473.64]